MKRKVYTQNGLENLKEISSFIFEDNPSAAARYIDNAILSFEKLPDLRYPKRASDGLPEYVREVPVEGFRGYVLRLAYVSDNIGLVAAFRPGLSDEMKDRITDAGMVEMRRFR